MTTINIEFDITDCRDCLYMKKHTGQGECWAECDNKKHERKVYDKILWECGNKFKSIPEWCPLGLGRG